MSKLITCFSLLLYTAIYAQSSDIIDENKDLLDKAKTSYEQKEYADVIKTLENILPQIDKSNMVEVHKYLGFSYARLNDKISAREHFKTLLKLNPHFTLNAQDADSSIIIIINEAKKEIAQESGMCSCFIPGAGQLIKGEDKKGKLIMLGSSLSLISSVLLWIETMNKQQNYLGIGPDSVEYMDEYYSEYNKWFRISVFGSTLFAGIYFYSIFDAIFANTTVKVESNNTNNTNSLHNIIPENISAKVGFKFRF
ncbi:MAG: tetratricopeptide repeat protein [candidate division WOR-3 bacterium]|nr:tetratricopeptide repeat protein [candidate division WOR-3 bacterium]